MLRYRHHHCPHFFFHLRVSRLLCLACIDAPCMFILQVSTSSLAAAADSAPALDQFTLLCNFLASLIILHMHVQVASPYRRLQRCPPPHVHH